MPRRTTTIFLLHTILPSYSISKHSIRTSIHLYIHTSIFRTFVPIHRTSSTFCILHFAFRSFIRSFVRLFVRLFIRSFVRPSVRSFVYSFVRPSVHPSVQPQVWCVALGSIADPPQSHPLRRHLTAAVGLGVAGAVGGA
jgi:hypothetical protein